MTPEQRIKQLETQVAELMKWKEVREKQQLVFPIDHQSMKALDNAFRETVFNEFHTRSVILAPVTSIPRTIKGQLVYYDDLGTQNFLMTTTVNPPDAADFTGRVNLTAV